MLGMFTTLWKDQWFRRGDGWGCIGRAGWPQLVPQANDLVCYPFRAPECIKLNAAIFRFTLVLSDLNVFT